MSVITDRVTDVDIVTGDDVALPVTLKKNSSTFAIDSGATIKAAIVSYDRATKYTADITQSNSTPGADWDNSLVVVEFNSATTASVTEYDVARVEIEVDDGGKLTWFVTVNIVKGSIS